MPWSALVSANWTTLAQSLRDRAPKEVIISFEDMLSAGVDLFKKQTKPRALAVKFTHGLQQVRGLGRTDTAVDQGGLLQNFLFEFSRGILLDKFPAHALGAFLQCPDEQIFCGGSHKLPSLVLGPRGAPASLEQALGNAEADRARRELLERFGAVGKMLGQTLREDFRLHPAFGSPVLLYYLLGSDASDGGGGGGGGVGGGAELLARMLSKHEMRVACTKLGYGAGFITEGSSASEDAEMVWEMAVEPRREMLAAMKRGFDAVFRWHAPLLLFSWAELEKRFVGALDFTAGEFLSRVRDGWARAALAHSSSRTDADANDKGPPPPPERFTRVVQEAFSRKSAEGGFSHDELCQILLWITAKPYLGEEPVIIECVHKGRDWAKRSLYPLGDLLTASTCTDTLHLYYPFDSEPMAVEGEGEGEGEDELWSASNVIRNIRHTLSFSPSQEWFIDV